MIETAIKMSLVTIFILVGVLTNLLWNKFSTTERITKERSSLIVKRMLPKENEGLLGTWIEPKYENKKEFQGFTLFADGTVKSINTGLLNYKEWTMRGNELSLWVESLVEGIYNQDIETYLVEQVSKDMLLLKIGDSTFKYRRVSS